MSPTLCGASWEIRTLKIQFTGCSLFYLLFIRKLFLRYLHSSVAKCFSKQIYRFLVALTSVTDGPHIIHVYYFFYVYLVQSHIIYMWNLIEWDKQMKIKHNFKIEISKSKEDTRRIHSFAYIRRELFFMSLIRAKRSIFPFSFWMCGAHTQTHTLKYQIYIVLLAIIKKRGEFASFIAHFSGIANAHTGL